MKVCLRCKRILDESHFYRDITKKDRLSSYCKDCKREYMREYHKIRLESNLCYDCGKPRPEGYIRFCPSCLKKRDKANKKYERQRALMGICRQCCKNPIDYTRSKLHCASCLDKRNLSKKKDDKD